MKPFWHYMRNDLSLFFRSPQGVLRNHKYLKPQKLLFDIWYVGACEMICVFVCVCVKPEIVHKKRSLAV